MNRPTPGDWLKLNLDWTASPHLKHPLFRLAVGSGPHRLASRAHRNLLVLSCGGGLSLFQCLATKQYSENFGTGGKVEFMLVELNWWAINC